MVSNMPFPRDKRIYMIDYSFWMNKVMRKISCTLFIYKSLLNAVETKWIKATVNTKEEMYV